MRLISPVTGKPYFIQPLNLSMVRKLETYDVDCVDIFNSGNFNDVMCHVPSLHHLSFRDVEGYILSNGQNILKWKYPEQHNDFYEKYLNQLAEKVKDDREGSYVIKCMMDVYNENKLYVNELDINVVNSMLNDMLDEYNDEQLFALEDVKKRDEWKDAAFNIMKDKLVTGMQRLDKKVWFELYALMENRILHAIRIKKIENEKIKVIALLDDMLLMTDEERSELEKPEQRDYFKQDASYILKHKIETDGKKFVNLLTWYQVKVLIDERIDYTLERIKNKINKMTDVENKLNNVKL